MKKWIAFVGILASFQSCKKNNGQKPVPSPFILKSQMVNGNISVTNVYYNVNYSPSIQFTFSGGAVDTAVAANYIVFSNNAGNPVHYTYSIINDSSILLHPQFPLQPISGYTVRVAPGLKSVTGASLQNGASISLVTSLDSTDKFPRISDSALLTLVQQQTFKYFWDFGHPVSGLARERNSSGDVVTTGGSGFGVMSILVGIQRSFVTRAQGLARMNQIVNFLINSAKRYHGAFPHWMNGATGATVPFSTQDDGADLVETSYLIQGLLCARQFFNNSSDTNEISLRNQINNIWNAVEWNWFRQNGQNVLYWHWSPNYGWTTNQTVNGWNEALITYTLAASSPVDSNRIPKIVYDNGWAMNGAIKNGKVFYGIQLPLGPDYGGPLFFAHYSFLGTNPMGLSDNYANYWTQDTAHSKINYSYCVANPNHFNGYSNLCWGLTASDEENGYSAHSPTNDDGVITPSAAISSLPYTPVQSMNALRFFYYTLGDKIWGPYGFVDAFNLTHIWFANSALAIDQGPEIIMIENYRTGLLWNLYMSCPEIKTGMLSLGFTGPNL